MGTHGLWETHDGLERNKWSGNGANGLEMTHLWG